MRCISSTSIQWVSGLTLSLFSFCANGQNVHISHCFLACPQGDDENEIVVRHLYASEINRFTGIADWVAYRILPETIGVASLLPRYWKRDGLVLDNDLLEIGSSVLTMEQPDLRDAQDRDYRVNEFVLNSDDRGRLTPMTSFAGTPYWDDLNYLSNMAPLPSDLRLGAWSRLDQAINGLSLSDSPIYVVSGPVYRSSVFDLEKHYEEPPERYFKIATTAKAYAAFVFEAELPIHSDYCSQIETIDEIQKLIDVSIFPDLKSMLVPDLFASLGCKQEYESLKNRNE